MLTDCSHRIVQIVVVARNSVKTLDGIRTYAHTRTHVRVYRRWYTRWRSQVAVNVLMFHRDWSTLPTLTWRPTAQPAVAPVTNGKRPAAPSLASPRHDRPIGSRFTLVSVLPTATFVLLIVALFASGTPTRAPELGLVDRAAGLTVVQAMTLMFTILVAAVLTAPFQLALVRAWRATGAVPDRQRTGRGWPKAPAPPSRPTRRAALVSRARQPDHSGPACSSR